MKTAPHNEQHFEDIATRAVGLGRQVAHLARDIHAGGTSLNARFVCRALDSIGNRRPFDQRDDASLDEVRRLLASDLETECLGTSSERVEVGYDPDGPILAFRECAAYTERGKKLLRLLQLFDAFMEARDATIDRAAAERAIRHFTSG